MSTEKSAYMADIIDIPDTSDFLHLDIIRHESIKYAILRQENAARTKKDFFILVKTWDKIKENHERLVRRYEIGRSNEVMLQWDKDRINQRTGKLKEGKSCQWRHTHLSGNFIYIIYNNVDQFWQLIEDKDISVLVKNLKYKRREVLFLRVVRLYTPQNIAEYHGKTDRAVRKLLDATIADMQRELAPIIREQIKINHPQITSAKRRFIDRYDAEQVTTDNNSKKSFFRDIIRSVVRRFKK